MSDEQPGGGGGDITRRQINPDPSTAEYDILEIVAELDGREIEMLPPLYNEAEHMVETLFRSPPSQRAQMELSFSYVGYRINIDRSGDVEVVADGQAA